MCNNVNYDHAISPRKRFNPSSRTPERRRLALRGGKMKASLTMPFTRNSCCEGREDELIYIYISPPHTSIFREKKRWKSWGNTKGLERRARKMMKNSGVGSFVQLLTFEGVLSVWGLIEYLMQPVSSFGYNASIGSPVSNGLGSSRSSAWPKERKGCERATEAINFDEIIRGLYDCVLYFIPQTPTCNILYAAVGEKKKKGNRAEPSPEDG